ncbi:hypothetical protein H0H92_006802 [Tricholoma furcatifolium]|nr:hypothetical protein H0H92_006802 [Tricholoma furcatifolium]
MPPARNNSTAASSRGTSYHTLPSATLNRRRLDKVPQDNGNSSPTTAQKRKRAQATAKHQVKATSSCMPPTLFPPEDADQTILTSRRRLRLNRGLLARSPTTAQKRKRAPATAEQQAKATSSGNVSDSTEASSHDKGPQDNDGNSSPATAQKRKRAPATAEQQAKTTPSGALPRNVYEEDEDRYSHPLDPPFDGILIPTKAGPAAQEGQNRRRTYRRAHGESRDRSTRVPPVPQRSVNEIKEAKRLAWFLSQDSVEEIIDINNVLCYCGKVIVLEKERNNTGARRAYYLGNYTKHIDTQTCIQKIQIRKKLEAQQLQRLKDKEEGSNASIADSDKSASPSQEPGTPDSEMLQDVKKDDYYPFAPDGYSPPSTSESLPLWRYSTTAELKRYAKLGKMGHDDFLLRKSPCIA